MHAAPRACLWQPPRECRQWASALQALVLGGALTGGRGAHLACPMCQAILGVTVPCVLSPSSGEDSQPCVQWALTWLLGGPGYGSVVVAVRFASVRDTDVLKPQSEEAPRARGVCPVLKLSPCRLSLLPPCLAFEKQRGCVHRAAAGWGLGWRCRGPGAVLTLAPTFSVRAERPSSGMSLRGSETFCH